MPPKVKAKKRARQTTLQFSSSPARARSPAATATATPASTSNPKTAFDKIMGPSTPSSAIKPRSAVVGVSPQGHPDDRRYYSPSDSEEDDGVGQRGRKVKVVGIAEARSGRSAGFFGGGVGLGRRRRQGGGRGRGRGRGKEDVDEEDEEEEGGSSSSVEIVVVSSGEEGRKRKGKGKGTGKERRRGSGENVGKEVVEVEVDGEDEDEDEKLKREIRERKKRRSGGVGGGITLAIAQGQGQRVTPTKKKVLLDESDEGADGNGDEGAESAEERKLKERIREKKRRDTDVPNEEPSNADAGAKKAGKRKGKKEKEKVGRKGKGKGRSVKKEELVASPSDEDAVEDTIKVEIATPQREEGRKGKGKGNQRELGESQVRKHARDSTDEEDDDVRPAGKRGKLKHRPEDVDKVKKEKVDLEITDSMRDTVKSWMIESEDDEAEVKEEVGGDVSDLEMVKGRRGRRGREKKVVFVDDEDEEEEEDEDDEAKHTLIDEEAEESSFAEDSDPQPPPRRPTKKRKPPPIQDLIDDDDLPIITPPRRRLRKSSPIAPPEDDSDLGSDLELAARTRVLESRTRYGSSPKKLTPAQRRFRELKAKREGVLLVLSEEEEEEEAGRALYDSDGVGGDDDDDAGLPGDQDNDEEEGEEEDIKPPRRRRRTTAAPPSDPDHDSDIDSFIASDTELTPLGAPSHPDARIPIQFTSQSHASLKTHFKTVLQYMLHLILNPSFPEKDDDYFTYALHAVDRRVNSFRDSVLKSEAWRGEFMVALRARPGFEFDPRGKGGAGGMWDDHCTACNRRDRNASYTVRFTGRMYDPETFEDYPSADDEDDDDDEEEEDGEEDGEQGEKVEVDDLGNPVPPSGTSFPVGRFCYERAEITHSFWHWKKGLRSALEEVLAQMGVFEEMRGAGVEGMGPGERARWVDGKLGGLEGGGDVSLLWDMFSAQMKRAEEFMGRPRGYFAGRG